MYKRFFVIAIVTVLVTVSCRRADNDRQAARVSNINCELLQNAMVNNDVAQVRTAITAFIAGLYTDVYTEPNLNELIRLIENTCNSIDGELFCFNCIKTLPPQSEIILRLNVGGTTIVKVIDLSSTPANKMKFVNMHD
jgi:hypothetical protein